MTYFVMAESVKATKDTASVIDRRACPLGCVGKMARLAERWLTEPYAWVPIGWRCTSCNTICWDDAVEVNNM